MYATYTRRKTAEPVVDEIRDRARDEFFAKVQRAPGFVSLTVLRGEDGFALALTVWESRAAAEAFQSRGESFSQLLDRVAPLESRGQGEVMAHLTPQR